MKSITELEDELQEQLTLLDQSLQEINKLTVTITEIPAPPFKERARAEFVQQYFNKIGYVSSIDEEGNVVAFKEDIAEPVIVSAHLDTVFEDQSISVKIDENKYFAPGVGDDSRGLANLLFLAKVLYDTEYVSSLVFVATVGEEGRGDLRGVKYLFSDVYSWSPRAFITIDGSTTEQIVDQAIGSLRFRLHFSGPGGHSYGSFGTVNPAFALGTFLSEFQNMSVSSSVKSTFSAGVVGGGTAINAIPEEVWVDLDLRSESPRELEKMQQAVVEYSELAVLKENQQREGSINYRLKMVGNRPAGKLEENSPVRQCLSAIHQHLSIPLRYHGSSTDANVPLSLGIPAISVASVEESGRAHTQDEWIDASSGSLLPIRRNLLLIVLLTQEL